MPQQNVYTDKCWAEFIFVVALARCIFILFALASAAPTLSLVEQISIHTNSAHMQKCKVCTRYVIITNFMLAKHNLLPAHRQPADKGKVPQGKRELGGTLQMYEHRLYRSNTHRDMVPSQSCMSLG